MRTISKHEIENALLQSIRDGLASEEQLREQRRAHEDAEEWEPIFTGPEQRKAYEDTSPYVLLHGMRGSGKTIPALHSDVRHCYLYDDALCLLTTITREGGKLGGAWEDLITTSLFNEGPLEGMPAGVLRMWEEGIDLRWGNFTTNNLPGQAYRDDSKNWWVDIVNIHGGISRICFKGMLHATQIADRIKNIKPSLFHMEEVTNTPVEQGAEYFSKVIQQLGRRRSVPASAQQWRGTCNPAEQGQLHWTYKAFFVDPHELTVDDKEKQELLASHAFDPEIHVRKWNKDFGVHFIPMKRNNFLANKEGYIRKIVTSARNDPTEIDRAVHGKWVPKITGESLFGYDWVPELHVKGKGMKGILPVPGEPLIIGYDPGNVNNARVFWQRLWTGHKWVWINVDSFLFNQKKLTFDILVSTLLRRMAWWNDRMDCNFTYYHISDRAALDQFNPHGSYDFREYHKVSKRMIEQTPTFAGLAPIRMRAPPKGADSVSARVKAIRELLASDALFVSATSRAVIDMFENLKKAIDRVNKQEIDDKPRKDAQGHIHTFDAASYPVYFFQTRGDLSEPVVERRNKTLALVSGSM